MSMHALPSGLREGLRNDLRSAFRALRRSPAFTSTVILSTAVGIGVATLVFGALYALLLRPLPLPGPDRLVAVLMTSPGVGTGTVSYPDFLDLAAQSRSFAGQGVHFTGGSLTLLDRRGPERVGVEAVSADLFRVLGVAPRLGRDFRPEDDRPGAPCVVLLGHDLWQRRYGGDPGLVGKTIVADEAPCRVIGIMPRDFRLWVDQEAWVPLASRREVDPASRSVRNLLMIARLRPGVPLDRAQAELREIGRRLVGRHPDTNRGWRVRVMPLRRFSLFSYALRRVLPSSAGFILLIACANLVHLLLMRTAARRREMAIRAAFGAGPGRIARQIFTESALLAGTGGALGALAAAAALHMAQGLRDRAYLPYWIRFEPGLAVGLFASAATAAFALFLGLPAVVQMGRLLRERPGLAAALKDNGAGGIGRSRRQQLFRDALVIAEVAVAVILLTGALLMARSLLNLRSERGGIGADRLCTAWLLQPGVRYADATVRARWIEDLLARLRTLPGVEAATASDDIFSYLSGGTALLETGERTERTGGTPPLNIFFNTVASDYFATLGVPLVSGRAPTRAEIAAGAEVAVINQALASRVWPAGDALGKPVWLLRGQLRDRFTVIGVAADIRHLRLRLPARPSLYIPFRYGLRRRAGILLQTDADPRELLPEVERRVHAMDPRVPLFYTATLDELRESSIIPDRLSAQAALLLGTAAFLLSLLGVYGVLSYTVSLRLREIGIRLALGARRGEVMRRIIGRGLALGLLGIALGLAEAVPLGRRLAPLLYGVGPTDPFSYALISVLVLDTVFVACYLPARRVLEVDPADVLRED
jgi:putative ABC transport system permease protein